MALSLEQFSKEMRGSLQKFQQHWLKMHKKNPGQWPLQFPDDDAGAWYEQFMAWYESEHS